MRSHWRTGAYSAVRRETNIGVYKGPDGAPPPRPSRLRRICGHGGGGKATEGKSTLPRYGARNMWARRRCRSAVAPSSLPRSPFIPHSCLVFAVIVPDTVKCKESPKNEIFTIRHMCVTCGCATKKINMWLRNSYNQWCFGPLAGRSAPSRGRVRSTPESNGGRGSCLGKTTNQNTTPPLSCMLPTFRQNDVHRQVVSDLNEPDDPAVVVSSHPTFQ